MKQMTLQTVKIVGAVVIALSVSVLIGVGYYYCFNSKTRNSEDLATLESMKEKDRLKDSIKVLLLRYEGCNEIIKSLKHRNDSLVMLKSNVEIKYKKDVQFIQGATPGQLDSIIRASWTGH